MKHKFENVLLEDIIEYPTSFGSPGCPLLKQYGLNLYSNTEEEIYEFISTSANNQEMKKICASKSCRYFLNIFLKGITPHNDKDPVKLTKYKNKYWVEEGKHRVCVAKRFGIQKIEAIVKTTEIDYSILPSIGQPGHFCNRYYLHTSHFSKNQTRSGKIFLLWTVPTGYSIPNIIHKYWFDYTKDTQSEWKQIIPGISYKVKVTKITKSFFVKLAEETIVDTEILIDKNHLKTKILLVEIPINSFYGPNSDITSKINVLYRYGCWRYYDYSNCINSLLPGFSTISTCCNK